ncbi:VOC family protein [Pseudonocardia thermophila]|uniref:VOC family protein n=1 Tax=Pseudonocardia thermophila TaxID=1848 RepID=UPI00248D4B14|nr:VOC family protein [Pseudonocardia thermophila]
MTAPIGSLHHVGIVVRHLETTAAFVGDALGFPVARQLDSPELGLRMVFYACGPALVELVEFADPAVAAARLGDRPAVLDHVALQVADLQNTHEALARHGVELMRATPLVTPLGRTTFTDPASSAGVIWQLLELAGTDAQAST